MFSPAVYNQTKTDFARTPIIMGEPRGLVDTIHEQYPEQVKLYEQLRGQDWTEKEFVFEICKVQFKTVDPVIANDMIRTLAWQWKTDSLAASTIAGIMSGVCSDSRVWIGYQRISDNESIHALTYSRIVQQSFDDPEKVYHQFDQDLDANTRLEVVGEVFGRAFEYSHRWALFQHDPKRFPLTEKEQYDAYDAMFMYIVALFGMERCQFMPSFAVTFGICESGVFQPIGDAIQRIAQDELEIHVPYGMRNIQNLLETERGREAYKNNRSLIVDFINETIVREDNWVDLLHQDGHENVGYTSTGLKKFGHFSGTHFARFMDVHNEVNFPLVDENPLPYMAKRVNLAACQFSPQEAPNPGYMVNTQKRDDQGKTFDFEL